LVLLRSLSTCMDRIHRLSPGWLAAAALLLSVWNWPVRAQVTPISEYPVKATLVFQFTQFVEWRPEAFSSPQTPLVIGVLGQDPFGTYLDQTVRGEMAGGHPLVVQRYRRLEDIKTCHVLFVSRSEDDH